MTVFVSYDIHLYGDNKRSGYGTSEVANVTSVTEALDQIVEYTTKKHNHRSGEVAIRVLCCTIVPEKT